MYGFVYVYTESQMPFIKHFPYARHQINSKQGISKWFFVYLDIRRSESKVDIHQLVMSELATTNFRLPVIINYFP